MNTDRRYSGHRYALGSAVMAELTRLRPWRSIAAMASVWLTLFAGIWAYRLLIPPHVQAWIYLPVGFLIAGRMGALLQLVHEASHSLIHPSKRWNLLLARWICAYPLCVMIDGYITGHRRHHAWAGTADDPPADSEKYRVADARDPRLYGLLLKDLLGITALGIFAAYGKSDPGEPGQRAAGPGAVMKFGGIALVQAVLVFALFGGHLVDYLLLWAMPAASFHMVLMRVRGIAEHGLARQLDVAVGHVSEGTFFTRSFLTPVNHYRFIPLVWLEKLLIGSLSVHFHHEHHLFPNVPFYNLKALHRAVGARVNATNPYVYATGYVSAALFSIFPHHEHNPDPASLDAAQ